MTKRKKKIENEVLSEYKFAGTGLSRAEKYQAQKQFDIYKSRHHIEKASDLQLLEYLVFRETIQERYKAKIAELAKGREKGKEEIPPNSLLKAMDDNLEQILILRDKLGLFKKKETDSFQHFRDLEKKFRIWEEEHKEERKVTCPFCSEIFFLHMRTGKYKESKLRLFRNKILLNKDLWKCYKEGLPITKERLALIFNVAPDYIDWLEKHMANNPS